MILLGLALGCAGESPIRDEPVPIDQIPAVAMEAAKKALPGYTFDTAFKLKVDGQDVFEIRGKDRKGKTREVEVTPAGEVLEIE